MPDVAAKTFPARVERLHELMAFSLAKASEAGVPEERTPLLELAIEELAVNICNHAYGGGEGDIAVRCGVENGRFFLALEDQGPPFNPLERPDPDITASIEDRPIGGLGVFLTKKSVDHLHYERKEDRNILTLEIILGGQVSRVS